ncbi:MULTISPECIES: fimbrial protein [Winslowiella]|uniref:fimbrial protein n=1 Tax=Winslowiella TaxID=2997349 RepID=UPI0028BD3B29|nr:fimbrial protein [Winslowiella toletana]WNN44045.1 fimbrial protein [Winslowiella toletana]
MLRFKIKIGTLLAACILPLTAQADTSMVFTGNLVVPLCTVNNNTQVTVPFGDVEIQTLTAVNTPYDLQEITIPVNCPYTLGAPRLTVTSSTVHDAAQGVLQTSKYSEGLVVYLRQKNGTTALPLGTETDVTSSVTGSGTARTLALTAGIGRIKDLDALTPGEFTASSTLQVRYQ